MSNGYAAYAYGTVPYIGGIPATITPADLQVGIPFMAGNDRYEVVVCADRGTSSSTPQFRYWYANGPTWGHELAGDTLIPHYYALDEDGTPVVGELQMSPRLFEQGRNNRFSANDVLVDSVLVDFIPRPSAATSETVSDSQTIGFTARVEGYGLTDYTRVVDTDPATTSGTAVSSSVTYATTAGEQASDTWPNMRSVKLPLRFQVRCRSIRAVLTDITLCEIVRVVVLGSSSPTRET